MLRGAVVGRDADISRLRSEADHLLAVTARGDPQPHLQVRQEDVMEEPQESVCPPKDGAATPGGPRAGSDHMPRQPQPHLLFEKEWISYGQNGNY